MFFPFMSVALLLGINFSYAASPLLCLKSKETQVSLSQIPQAEALNVGSDSVLYISKTKSEIRSASLVVSLLPISIPFEELSKTSFSKRWIKDHSDRLIQKGFKNVVVSASGFQNMEENKIYAYSFTYLDTSSNKMRGKGGVVFNDKKGILKFDFRADSIQFSKESGWISKVLTLINWECGQ